MNARRPRLFFALVFGWSWLLWLPAALSAESYRAFPNVLLLILGGFGPTGAAVLLVHRQYSRRERRDFWRRVFGRIIATGSFGATG